MPPLVCSSFSFVLAGLARPLTLALWIMLAAVLVLGGSLAASAVKRWIQRDVREPAFTLQDLRDMRARGEITEAEFAALRAEMLNEVVKRGGDPPEPSAGS